MYPVDKGHKRKDPAVGSLQATSNFHENLPLAGSPWIEMSMIPLTYCSLKTVDQTAKGAKQAILSPATEYLTHTPPLVRPQYLVCYRENRPHFRRTLLRLNYINTNKSAHI